MPPSEVSDTSLFLPLVVAAALVTAIAITSLIRHRDSGTAPVNVLCTIETRRVSRAFNYLLVAVLLGLAGTHIFVATVEIPAFREWWGEWRPDLILGLATVYIAFALLVLSDTWSSRLGLALTDVGLSERGKLIPWGRWHRARVRKTWLGPSLYLESSRRGWRWFIPPRTISAAHYLVTDEALGVLETRLPTVYER